MKRVGGTHVTPSCDVKSQPHSVGRESYFPCSTVPECAIAQQNLEHLALKCITTTWRVVENHVKASTAGKKKVCEVAMSLRRRSQTHGTGSQLCAQISHECRHARRSSHNQQRASNLSGSEILDSIPQDMDGQAEQCYRLFRRTGSASPGPFPVHGSCRRSGHECTKLAEGLESIPCARRAVVTRFQQSCAPRRPRRAFLSLEGILSRAG